MLDISIPVVSKLKVYDLTRLKKKNIFSSFYVNLNTGNFRKCSTTYQVRTFPTSLLRSWKRLTQKSCKSSMRSICENASARPFLCSCVRSRWANHSVSNDTTCLKTLFWAGLEADAEHAEERRLATESFSERRESDRYEAGVPEADGRHGRGKRHGRQRWVGRPRDENQVCFAFKQLLLCDIPYSRTLATSVVKQMLCFETALEMRIWLMALKF